LGEGGSTEFLRGISTHHNQILEENAMEYVLNVSLTFGFRGDAERAEKQLATTFFDGLVGSWSEVEAVRR
jgi:hypothetical protein